MQRATLRLTDIGQSPIDELANTGWLLRSKRLQGTVRKQGAELGSTSDACL